MDDNELIRQSATDRAWMLRCDELAGDARSRGEAGVGAVILRGGEMVAEASEQVLGTLDIAGHAEMIAIRLACAAIGSMELSGCTLYTNIEPCWMCSYAIREARISEVVIGAAIEDIGGATSRYPI